jgi:nucleotide-binding universal stress UspA family protein
MYHHILVPLDGSPLAMKALQHACQLAQTMAARVTLLHVSAEYPVTITEESVIYHQVTRAEYAALRKKEAERILGAAVRKAERLGVAARMAHEFAPAPWRAILSTAKKLKCDAIVMASHGRGGVASLLLGNETQKVLAHSRLPVLVVR